ncbi:AAA family ATPase [Marinicrinis lubricantis]|uniref:AAA family ATPase n=1 Tax=Marinicrinis lubricantis TaxID=2086470 RepID=A0ABW1IK24_9BACL
MKHTGDRGVFLITGVMASGKSTVAQQFAEKLNRGVHLRGDTFRKMIVSGREEMVPGASDEALRQLRLRYQIASSAADTYFDAGFNVVLQDVMIGTMLQDVIHMIRSRPLYVIVLTPSREAVAKREAERPKKGYGIWTIADLDDQLRHGTPKIGMWIDTTEQTPEETVEQIWNCVWTEGRI